MDKTGRLIEILENESELYSELFRCLEEKQPSLARTEVARINAMVERETELIGDLKKLEKSRVELVRDWGAEEGLDRDDMTLKGIIQRVEGEERQLLRQLFDELTETLERIARINKENERIIADSLHYMDFSINLLRPSQAGDDIYGPTGQAQKSQVYRILDRQA